MIINSFTQPIHLNTLIYSETTFFVNDFIIKVIIVNDSLSHPIRWKKTDSFKKKARYELVINSLTQPICLNTVILSGIK